MTHGQKVWNYCTSLCYSILYCSLLAMSTTKSPLGVSDYINIRSFLENWGAILTAEDIIQVKESDISAAISHDLNVGQSVVKELQDVCG